MQAERVELPHAVDAERAVIGAMLVNWELICDLAVALRAEHFIDKRHQLIWKTAMGLHEKGHVDPFILTGTLKDMAKLNEAGGTEYIADLADIGAAPVNVKAYSELIYGKAMLREAIAACVDSLAEFHRPGEKTPYEALDAAEQRLSLVAEAFRTGESRFGKVDELSGYFMQKCIDNRADMRALHGVNPGYRQLHDATMGFKGGELLILAGRPGEGKTAFAANVVHNITADPSKGVLWFSLEMSAEQMVGRLLSLYGLNTFLMMRAAELSHDTLEQLCDAQFQLSQRQIVIDDSGTLNAIEARSRARRTKRMLKKDGVDLSLIVVDYLGLMEGQGENKAVEVARISRSLKSLARELNVPVLALCQMNRNIETRAKGEPMLSDLRDSGAIEQDADAVMFLHETDEATDLIIRKQRSGPLATIPFHFDKQRQKFTEQPCS